MGNTMILSRDPRGAYPVSYQEMGEALQRYRELHLALRQVLCALAQESAKGVARPGGPSTR
jgi:hypothetical protein